MIGKDLIWNIWFTIDDIIDCYRINKNYKSSLEIKEIKKLNLQKEMKEGIKFYEV